MEDPEDAGEEGEAEDGAEEEAFEAIHDEGGGGGAVEAEALFDDEGVDDGEGEADEGLAEEEEGEEGEADEDGVFEPGACGEVEPVEAAEGPEGEEDGEGGGGLEDVEAGVDAEVIAGAVEFCGVHEIGEFIGDLCGEGFDVEEGGGEFQLPKGEEADQDDQRHEVPIVHRGDHARRWVCGKGCRFVRGFRRVTGTGRVCVDQCNEAHVYEGDEFADGAGEWGGDCGAVEAGGDEWRGVCVQRDGLFGGGGDVGWSV